MNGEQFEAHPVWQSLAGFQSEIERDFEPTNQEERDAVRRLHAAAEFVDNLRDIDPALVEPQPMNDLHTYVEQIRNQVVAIPGNRANLTSAAGVVTSIMATTRAHFPPPTADSATRAAKAAATRYKNSLDAEVETLRKANESLQGQLTEAEEARTAAEAAATERLEELKAAITEHETTVGTLTTTLQAQIDGQRTTFTAEAQQRETAFKEAERLRGEAGDASILAVEEAAANARTEQQGAAAAVLAQLEAYQEQAAALVDTTSRHAIAGDYTTWAAKQGRAALTWTIAALGLGIATVAVLIYALRDASDDSVQFTVYKTSISIVGLILAGYAARQASEHRHQERTAKRLSLDLAALEPFLAHVENAETLRTAVATRVFAPAAPEATDGNASLRTRRGGHMTIQELTALVTALRGGGQP